MVPAFPRCRWYVHQYRTCSRYLGLCPPRRETLGLMARKCLHGTMTLFEQWQRPTPSRAVFYLLVLDQRGELTRHPTTGSTCVNQVTHKSSKHFALYVGNCTHLWDTLSNVHHAGRRGGHSEEATLPPPLDPQGVRSDCIVPDVRDDVLQEVPRPPASTYRVTTSMGK